MFKELFKSNYLQKSKKEITSSYFIPEPTKSLLWISDESPSKRVSTGSIEITISAISIEDNEKDRSSFYAEPSLIWTQLSIKKNNSLETEKMYYPDFYSLTPKQRYQYLNWLRDITEETNLSYVFLYYYGLERHLLIGNYDLAVDEIVKLIKYHDKGTFKSYAIVSLIAATIYRKRNDILDKAPYILDEISNTSLFLRALIGKSLDATMVLKLTNKSGFKNKRYIQKFPELFKKILQNEIGKYIEENGSILEQIDIQNIPKEEEVLFANTSIPSEARSTNSPQILEDKNFQSIIYKLLEKTHLRVKDLKSKKK